MRVNRFAYEVYVSTPEGRRTYGATSVEAVCEILRRALPEARRDSITPEFVQGWIDGKYRFGKDFGINYPFHIYGDVGEVSEELRVAYDRIARLRAEIEKRAADLDMTGFRSLGAEAREFLRQDELDEAIQRCNRVPGA